MRRLLAVLTIGLLTVEVPNLAWAQEAPQQAGGPTFTLSVTHVNLVLTNVAVRDKKTGELVKGLKASDFQHPRGQKAADRRAASTTRASTRPPR